MKHAYSYIRFSRPEQLKGDSLRRQMKYAEDYCAKHGLTLDESLTMQDLGVSAFRGRNATKGALAGFLEAVELGKVPAGSVLIVENLDRISRNEMLEQLGIFTSILKAGITIATMNPEREYTRASVNDGFGIMEAIVHMARAHEESARKAERLSQAWVGKRLRMDKEKLTGRIPAWLTIKPGRSGFDVREESAKIVRSIFRDAADGVGINTITKRLNEANVVNFGNRSKTGWHVSYVLKILNNRAVLGEFQPHAMQNGKRKPLGEPVPNYYPAIVDEGLFYAAQKGLASRRTAGGRRGKGVANLFSGLLYSFDDGLPMNIVDKGDGKRLVSSGARRGRPGSVYRGMKYQLVEDALLHVIRELREEEVKTFNSEPDPVAAIDGQLEDLAQKIARVKQRAEAEDDTDAILDLLQSLSQKQKGLIAERKRLLSEQAVKPQAALTETHSLIDQMRTAQGEGRERQRERLKSRIRYLVKGIAIAPQGRPGKGMLVIYVCYRHEEQTRMVVIDERTGNLSSIFIRHEGEEFHDLFGEDEGPQDE